MNPVVDQIDLLHQLAPEAKKVGLLYCTAESNSRSRLSWRRRAQKLGIEGVEYTASSSNEVQQVVESMMGRSTPSLPRTTPSPPL
ncbi:MAG: ABC transporter substrate binding protein [Collinsella intestinalis]